MPAADSIALNLVVTHTADGTVVVPQGEIDVHTATALRDCLTELVEQGQRALVVDLHETTFIDSTGLGVLVGALKRARQADGDLVLAAPRRSIAKVFEVTGMDKTFEVLDHRPA
jgi:anti-sigma B factor antagonist